MSYFYPNPVQARITQPPLPRPAYTPPPPTPDHILYEEIFELHEQAKWKQADRQIRQLNDKTLMGHVLRLRYMHPTAYRASWSELRDWLYAYADHPGAWQVYNLAKKRRPRGAKMPPPPPSRVWAQASAQKGKQLFRSRASRSIRNEVRRLTYRERPTQALKYINKRSIDRQLTAGETDWLRALIARSYYIEGKPGKSLETALKATRSRHLVPKADWHAGLAAWRLGDVETALHHFTLLLSNERASANYRAAAGVWAARSVDALGLEKQGTKFLKQAVLAGKNNFYALLAQHKLQGRIKVTWTYDKPQEVSDLSAFKAVKRAEKLLQANQQELAELELLYLGERLGEKQKQSLLELARERRLPAVELAMTYLMDIGTQQEPDEISEGQFPIPAYEPTTGYRLDKAVLFGLIRQESRFKARAKSSAGARGLMQIMPNTAAFVTGDRKLRYRSGRDRLYRMSFNMNIGQAYLEGLLEDENINNNLVLALGSYNAGPGNVRRWQREIGPTDDPLLFIESLPAPETRHYIRIVMRNIWLYRDKMDQEAVTLEMMAMGDWPTYSTQENKIARNTSGLISR
ncbi:MAG: lytic transglycosylase domain-containing protein [Parvibaculales bacterium]